MKIKLLVFLIFIALSNIFAQRLKWKYVAGGGQEGISVYGNKVWVVGFAGMIRHSSDGGMNFSFQDSRTKEHLNDVCFVDDRHGWAVGYSGTIIATSDGGATWNFQNSGVRGNLNAVTFIDTLRGWVCGRSVVSLNTTDGGLTWRRQWSVGGVDMFGISFADSLHGWSVGSIDSVFKTTDGGNNWSKKYYGFGGVDVDFVDSLNGWVVVEGGGTIIHSSDGGDTWQAQYTSSRYLYSVDFIDSLRGYAVGGWGRVMRTTDGGRNWIGTDDNGTSTVLKDAKFFDFNKGYACGGGGSIIRTTDGGLSWQGDRGTADGLFGVYFFDFNTGIVAGDLAWGDPRSPIGGQVCKSTNRRRNWLNKFNPNIGNSITLSFYNSSYGICGGNGASPQAFVARTSDSGESWTSVFSDTSFTIESVFQLDSSVCWGGGHLITPIYYGRGVVVNTTDGGLSWTKRVIDSPSLFSIFFVDRNRGWAVGGLDSVMIMATSDGGLNWNRQYYRITGGFLGDCYFVDSLTGWTVGAERYGVILKTTDGGQNWITQFQASRPIMLFTIFMVDRDYGWAMGGGGGTSGDYNCYYTTNGGTNWLPDTSDILRNRFFFDVFFIDRRNGFAVGNGGIVLKYEDLTGVEEESSKLKVQSSKLNLDVYPSPMRSDAIIHYSLPQDTLVSLNVYNIAGQLVRTLVNGKEKAGYKTVVWDGKNLSGRMVSAGIYFYRLDAGNFSTVKKLVVLR